MGRKLLTAVLSMLLMIGIFAAPVQAATAEQDGLHVTLTADMINISRVDDYMNQFTITTDAQGYFSTDLRRGDYGMEIVADGDQTFTSMINMEDNGNVHLNVYLMEEGADQQSGTACGLIVDAFSGMCLEGVMLEVRSGWNYLEGETVTTVFTDADGRYKLELPRGHYSLYALKAGYVPSVINITTQSGAVVEQVSEIWPEPTENDLKIVLTWRDQPADLDAYMQAFGMDYYHVSAYYYVYQYSADDGKSGTSGATVELYQAGNLIHTFEAPIEHNDGNYWNVFAIHDGKIYINDSVTEEPDVEYIDSYLSLE